ncbi:MAG: hypothetical protein MJZ05_06415 [Fibrobacter sp.]|nr:hypothetical protein [Fibrobacter sp.]
MKTSIKASLFATFTLLLGACSTDKPAGDVANGYTEEQGFAFKGLNGICEKGPFLKGSEVIMYELDSATFQKTGKTFETTVYDNRGRFTFPGDTIKYPVVLLEATGHYTDDITGEKSKHPATLYALVNLSKTNSVYMNMLSIVEYSRIDYLMETDSMSYDEAKKQAREEVQVAFSNDSVAGNLEDKSMFGDSDESAYLFALNVMLQAAAKDGNANEILEKIINDLKKDGTLDSIDLQKMFADQVDSMNIGSIRENFSDTLDIPEFEKYLCDAIGDKAEETNGCKNTDISATSSSSETSISSSSNEESINSSSSKGSLTTTNVDCSKYNKSNWAYLNPDIKYGCILDGRDGQVYKTVVIGKDTWMAENLNYNPGYGGSEYEPYGWSWCYENDSKNCETYGRLYTKAAAMDSINQGGFGYASAIQLGENFRGACPADWHVPTSTDIDHLMAFVESGKGVFKAKKGWDNDANGSDVVGFSALPGGYKDKEGFKSLGTGTVWRNYSGNATYIYRIFGDDMSEDSDRDGSYAYYIRCVKNSADKEISSSSSKVPEIASSSSEVSTSKTTEVDCSKYSKSNWDYLNPDIEYGCILDGRDKQVYKTVVIGEDTWLAENLNFNPGYGGSEYEPYGWSWCYENDPKNCETYGRLYTKGAAMDSINQGGFGYASASLLGENFRGVCPEDWHVPTSTDIDHLMGHTENLSGKGVLKARKGWDNDANGTDAIGFSALPGGYKDKEGFKSLGTGTVWRNYSGNATYIYRIFGDNMSEDSDRDGSYAYYIRCVKNAK